MNLAVVQARSGSSRLPNKALLHLHGKPVIEWVFERLKACNDLDDIVFALPVGPMDDPLEFVLKELGANTFRGSEEDVLTRCYLAVEAFKPERVIRICADNPLVSPECITQLVQFFRDSNFDYAYNHIPRGNSYPDGLGAEIVSFDLFEMVYLNARENGQREHILNYIWDNQDQFKIGTFNPPDLRLHRPEVKLDIDTPEDFLYFLKRAFHPKMSDLEIIELVDASN